jgi:hypothetical protein
MCCLSLQPFWLKRLSSVRKPSYIYISKYKTDILYTLYILYILKDRNLAKKESLKGSNTLEARGPANIVGHYLV